MVGGSAGGYVATDLANVGRFVVRTPTATDAQGRVASGTLIWTVPFRPITFDSSFPRRRRVSHHRRRRRFTACTVSRPGADIVVLRRRQPQGSGEEKRVGYEGLIGETISLRGHNGDLIEAYQSRPLGVSPVPGSW